MPHLPSESIARLEEEQLPAYQMVCDSTCKTGQGTHFGASVKLTPIRTTPGLNGHGRRSALHNEGSCGLILLQQRFNLPTRPIDHPHSISVINQNCDIGLMKFAVGAGCFENFHRILPDSAHTSTYRTKT